MNFSEQFTASYEILDLLGEGGMGRVYRARQRALGRLVAIKVVKLAATEDRARFVRESKALAALDHPSILRVFDAGYDGELPYQICELIEGRDALAALADGTMNRATALQVICEVADGLAYAHARGLVHRDVKPENVFLGKGFVKLADFGLARPVEAGHTLTAAGMILGTPAFLAPEVIRGERASPASDQYALGVMAYQLLSGELPFKGESFFATLQAHLDGARAPLSSVAPGLDPAIARAVERALSREPADRFDSVADLAAALRGNEAPAGDPVPAPPSRDTRATRPLSRPLARPVATAAMQAPGPRWPLALVAGALLAAGTGWLAFKPPRPVTPIATPSPARPAPEVDAVRPPFSKYARAIAERALPSQRGRAARDALIAITPDWRALHDYLRPYAERLTELAAPAEDRVLYLNAVANLRAFDAILRNADLPDLKAHELLGTKFAPGIDLEDLHGTRLLAAHTWAFQAGVPKGDLLTDLIDNQPKPFSFPKQPPERVWLEVQVPRLQPQDSVWLHLTDSRRTTKIFIDEMNEPRHALKPRSGVAFQRIDPHIFEGDVMIVAREENVSGTNRTAVQRVLGIGFHGGGPPPPLSTVPGVELAGRWRFEAEANSAGTPLSQGVITIEPRGDSAYNEATISEQLVRDETPRKWDIARVHATASRIRVDRAFSMGGNAFEIQTWFLDAPRDEHPAQLVGQLVNVPVHPGSPALRLIRLPSK